MKVQLPHLDDFLLHLQTDNYSEETIYNYERDLEVFRDFLEEVNTEFEKIDKKTILNYKAYLTSRDRKTPKNQKGKKKLVSYSINRMLSSLRSYLKYLIDMDYKPVISPDAVKLVRTERKHPQVAEFKELVKLIESPSKLERNKIIALRNRAMLEMLFSTGMRISELVNLKELRLTKQDGFSLWEKVKRKDLFISLPGLRSILTII